MCSLLVLASACTEDHRGAQGNSQPFPADKDYLYCEYVSIRTSGEYEAIGCEVTKEISGQYVLRVMVRPLATHKWGVVHTYAAELGQEFFERGSLIDLDNDAIPEIVTEWVWGASSNKVRVFRIRPHTEVAEILNETGQFRMSIADLNKDQKREFIFDHGRETEIFILKNDRYVLKKTYPYPLISPNETLSKYLRGE